MSPLNAPKEGSLAGGSSIKRESRKDRSKRGSQDNESATSPSKRGASNTLGAGRKKTERENRQKELRDKNLVSGDFKGLSSEYPSFELLWFDIESKTRHLVQEIIDPVVDKLVDNSDKIN